jgi:hypothetical protein
MRHRWKIIILALGFFHYVGCSKETSFTHENLILFAENIFCFEDLFHTIVFTWNTD